MADQSSLQFYYSGYEKCSAGHFFGPTVRVHYLIHLVINGKGLYQVGKNTYSVCTNQAFLIRPQEVTFYAADDEDPWEYLWFAFNGHEADRLIASFFPEIRRMRFLQNVPRCLHGFYRQRYHRFKNKRRQKICCSIQNIPLRILPLHAAFMIIPHFVRYLNGMNPTRRPTTGNLGRKAKDRK